MKFHKIIVLTGPTAAGKSNFAIKIAKQINGAIINGDSLQVYKEIPTLTASPAVTEGIDHHLYNIIHGNEKFSVSIWLSYVRDKLNQILSEDKTPIIVGGSAMYIRSLIDGLNEIPDIPVSIRQEAENLLLTLGIENFFSLVKQRDPLISCTLKNDRQRLLRRYMVLNYTNRHFIDFLSKERHNIFLPQEKIFKIALLPLRETIYQECNKRFIDMINNGAIEEAIELKKLNYNKNSTIHKASGLREIYAFLEGKLTKEQMIEKACVETRRYAKRQFTWFRNKFNDFYKLTSPNIEEIFNLLK